jgi:hypothetical protein
MERGAGLPWNQWQVSPGIGGSFTVEYAAALGRLSVARILGDVGDQARIENALPIVRGIKAAIEVEIGASEV